MLRIEMPRKELTVPPEVTIGNRKRYSTATDVNFINDNLLVSACFNNKRLYLIELTADGYNILQELKTRHHPDLMDYKDGMIATSDYPFMEPNGHASIYNLVDGNVVFVKEIPLVNTKAHGCAIIDKNTVIITSNSDENRGLLFIDINTGKIVQHFNNLQHYPKDCFINGDKLYTVCAKSLPQIGQTTVIGESILYVFNKDTMEKIDEITFHGQTDSLTVTGEDIFVVVQGDDTLVHITLTNNKLSFVKRIGGFNFPHGISCLNNKVAVTNYGDNTIRIFDLDELKSL